MHFKKKVPGFRISKYMSQYSYYKALKYPLSSYYFTQKFVLDYGWQ